MSTSSSGTAGGASVTPVDCFLNSSRVLTIATSFGFSIFVLVYASAAFSGGQLSLVKSHLHTSCESFDAPRMLFSLAWDQHVYLWVSLHCRWTPEPSGEFCANASRAAMSPLHFT